jgi:hypothetical protein
LFLLTIPQEDDDEMPDLEDDKAADQPESAEEVKEDKPEASATPSKIQEVS